MIPVFDGPDALSHRRHAATWLAVTPPCRVAVPERLTGPPPLPIPAPPTFAPPTSAAPTSAAPPRDSGQMPRVDGRAFSLADRPDRP